jgi:GAF domain-containing protein
MDQSKLELARAFADIARELSDQETVPETLEEIVARAVDVIPGCDFAGVSWLVRGQEIETKVCTNDIARLCDAASFEFHEGPPVEFEWTDEIELITDMYRETRWPQFTKRAISFGVGSMCACELPAPRRVIGALNLYAFNPESLNKDSVEFLQIFAAHAAIALTSRQVETELRAAVDTRGEIGQAIGILMERHKLTSREGFQLLAKASQRSHVKLKDVAAFVVETGVEPQEAGKLTAGSVGT